MQSPQISIRPQTTLSPSRPLSISPSPSRSAFTLVELMVVILIIALLMGILIPTISAVRRSSYAAKTQSILSQLSAAIEAYHTDYRAYPGPVPNNQIGINVACGITSGVTVSATHGVTMSENLLLGLSGGLGINGAGAIVFDPNAVNTGPRILATSGINVNRAHAPYVENIPMSANNTFFADDLGSANDTEIPEYVDGYPKPLPILYLRAKSGAPTNIAAASETLASNNVITNGSYNGQYDLSQIIGYTGSGIGEGKDTSKQSLYNNAAWPNHGLRSINMAATTKIGVAGYTYPYETYSYFGNPSFLTGASFSQPRQKDGYILISAGPDRIYGTEDDVTSFGSFNFAK